jgi:hypothetical protein
MRISAASTPMNRVGQMLGHMRATAKVAQNGEYVESCLVPGGGLVTPKSAASVPSQTPERRYAIKATKDTSDDGSGEFVESAL